MFGKKAKNSLTRKILILKLITICNSEQNLYKYSAIQKWVIYKNINKIVTIFFVTFLIEKNINPICV